MKPLPCPVCGRDLVTRRRGAPAGVRKIYCPACRFRIFDYPRSCAGMVVLRGDRVLLLRRGEPPRKGCYEIPGGFLEAGESTEQAARRELAEETGLSLEAVRALGLYWDRYYLRGFGWFPTLNAYYVGRWSGGEPSLADDAATGSAEWVPVRALGRRSGRFAWRHLEEVFADLRRELARNGRG